MMEIKGIIWKKRGGLKIPTKDLFNMNDNKCPICYEEIDLNTEKWKDGKTPYIRHNENFYYCHKECYVFLYKCIKEIIEEHESEAIIEAL